MVQDSEDEDAEVANEYSDGFENDTLDFINFGKSVQEPGHFLFFKN